MLPTFSFFPAFLILLTGMVCFLFSGFAAAAIVGEVLGFGVRRGWSYRIPLVFNDAAWYWFKLGFTLRGWGLPMNDVMIWVFSVGYLLLNMELAHLVNFPMILAGISGFCPAIAMYLSSGEVVSIG